MTMQYKLHTFSWKGLTAQNQTINGEIQAISINFAKVNLQQQGLFITDIRKKRFILKKKISRLDLVIFFRQLATLISAGIPILQCCETLRQNHKNPTLQSLLADIKKDIEAGHSFSICLQKFPQYFNDFTIHLLRAGEQSGTLDIMLNRIASYQEKNLQLLKRIQQALLYPAIITIVSLIVSLIMLLFVVPRFETLFLSMHHTLPAFTRAVIAFSHFLQHWFWLSFFLFLPLIIAKNYFKSHRFKKLRDQTLLKIPILNSILQKIILARFARCMATLFSSGIPIIEALTLAAKLCGNILYRHAILNAQNNVSIGKQLHSSLPTLELFPPIFINMIKIGEESGALDKMLDKLADLYESDVDYFISNLSQLLEPLIMAVLGVLIGGLVIAMYLPIFKLGTVI